MNKVHNLFMFNIFKLLLYTYIIIISYSLFNNSIYVNHENISFKIFNLHKF